MRADVRTDFDWGRTFVPEIKRVVANYLIVEAPEEEDTQRNTDLMVLRAETKRIACRVRKHKWLGNAHEFTIRSDRPKGTETELGKMLSGWGDYIFYGIADSSESRLAAYVLGDLHVFRLWYMRTLTRLGAGERPGKRIQNRDGSSSFDVFRIADLPEGFVLSHVRSNHEAA